MREAWASALLSWEWRPPLLMAEVSAARYVLRIERHEVLAHAEIRDTCGRYRVDVGSFRDVAAAKAACELHAAALCKRDREEWSPVDVRIALRRRRRGLVVATKPARAREPVPAAAGDLDAALAAFAGAIEEEVRTTDQSAHFR